MTAVRLARGATGRSKIVKFAGCYHGHADALLAQAGQRRRDARAARARPASRRAPSPTPSSFPTTTSPRSTARSPSTAPTSPRSSSSRSPRTWAWSRPPTASSPGCASGARSVGALLVFDEVITGFRVGVGGAQERFAITPDLSIFGKVVGGGLPLAAIGGPAALMDELAPLGPVYQAGTLSGNPLATAAGLAVLAQLDAGRVRRARSDRRAARRRAARRVRRRRRRRAGHARVHARRRVLRAGAGAQLRRRARRRPRAVRELLPRSARPRRVLRAERLRDAVPEPRPHRRRHRPHDRSRRRECELVADAREAVAVYVDGLVVIDLTLARRRRTTATPEKCGAGDRARSPAPTSSWWPRTGVVGGASVEIDATSSPSSSTATSLTRGSATSSLLSAAARSCGRCRRRCGRGSGTASRSRSARSTRPGRAGRGRSCA